LTESITGRPRTSLAPWASGIALRYVAVKAYPSALAQPKFAAKLSQACWACRRMPQRGQATLAACGSALQRSIFLSESLVYVRFGSLADMLGCAKKRPLYPSKQTLLGVGIEVRYVPEADIFESAVMLVCCPLARLASRQ